MRRRFGVSESPGTSCDAQADLVLKTLRTRNCFQHRTFWAIPSAAKRRSAGQDGFDPLKVGDLRPYIGQMRLGLFPDFGASPQRTIAKTEQAANIVQ